MSAAVELFVPGRVCMLGEHSDWAGQLPGCASPTLSQRTSERHFDRAWHVLRMA